MKHTFIHAMGAAVSICLGIWAITLYFSDAALGQPVCTSVFECAQKALQAALDARNAAQSATTQKVKPEPGKSMKCNSYYAIQPAQGQDRWNNAQIEIECPSNTVRVGGGCEFTCLGIDHTTSVPTDNNGWRCGVISSDPTRSFRPVALCMHLGGGP